MTAQSGNARFEGSKRRWQRFRRLSGGTQVLVLVFLSPLVLLYVTPWEDVTAAFVAAPRRVQAAIVALVLVVAAIGVVVARTQGSEQSSPAGLADADGSTQTKVDDGMATTPATHSREAAEVPAEPEARPGRLFRGRPDAQPADQERRRGQFAEISGVSARVLGWQWDDSYVAVRVEVRNGNDDGYYVSQNEFRLQTPNRRVLDSGFQHFDWDGELVDADLLPGGRAVGNVLFDVGAERGEFYVLWKPGVDRDRGVWRIRVTSP